MQLKFRYDYQDTTDGVSQDEFLVLLGDFNARVGLDEECWRRVVGRHSWRGTVTALCYESIVMNMWLKKKSVWYGTWNHPATRVSHMIDLVMM